MFSAVPERTRKELFEAGYTSSLYRPTTPDIGKVLEMTGIDYQSNAKYFRPVSYKAGIILIIFGFLLLFPGKSAFILLGLAIAGVGILLILRQVVGKPADAEIDRQTDAVIRDIVQQALRKLGLDREEVSLIEPIVIGGHTYSPPVKKGKDGRFRSSRFEVAVIFFGEQELHSYKYQLSLVADENRENTDVYFYRDVVSVSTHSTSREITVVGETKPQAWKTEVFSLTTSGGTAVECMMSDSSDHETRTIQGARQLVRNKKMHAL